MLVQNFLPYYVCYMLRPSPVLGNYLKYNFPHIIFTLLSITREDKLLKTERCDVFPEFNLL
jgi:hypothetical protein